MRPINPVDGHYATARANHRESISGSIASANDRNFTPRCFRSSSFQTMSA
jgi:hypothetical protein